MAHNVIAEYRQLYRSRHGIACPLTDAQIRTAMGNTTPATDESDWPLNLDVVTEMETLVTSSFPSVDQARYQHGGNLTPIDDLAQSSGDATTADLDWTETTGGNAPYSYQLQQAEDSGGVAGDYADVGAAQSDNTQINLTGLSVAVWWRLKVTDNNGEIIYSNEIRALLAPADLAVDNEQTTTVDNNFGAAVGGVAPLSYQLQVAPDVAAAPGTWANSGTAIATPAEIVATGLTTMTDYWFRIKVTDSQGSISYSNEETTTTA